MGKYLIVGRVSAYQEREPETQKKDRDTVTREPTLACSTGRPLGIQPFHKVARASKKKIFQILAFDLLASRMVIINAAVYKPAIYGRPNAHTKILKASDSCLDF